MPRGYCEIGIYHGKKSANLGTLWRSAYQLGAQGIFTIAHRYDQQSSDTLKAWRHIPLRQFATAEEFFAARPYGSLLIGVEMDGKPLQAFTHPERALYLLGAEDHGLPPCIQAQCQEIIAIPAVRTLSYNVAVAGSIVLYHRLMQHEEAHHA